MTIKIINICFCVHSKPKHRCTEVCASEIISRNTHGGTIDADATNMLHLKSLSANQLRVAKSQPDRAQNACLRFGHRTEYCNLRREACLLRTTSAVQKALASLPPRLGEPGSGHKKVLGKQQNTLPETSGLCCRSVTHAQRQNSQGQRWQPQPKVCAQTVDGSSDGRHLRHGPRMCTWERTKRSACARDRSLETSEELNSGAASQAGSVFRSILACRRM